MHFTISCIRSHHMQPNGQASRLPIQTLLCCLLFAAVAFVAQARIPDRAGATNPQDRFLSSLQEGDQVLSFRAAAVYLNDTNEIAGARFVHEPTLMPVDILLFDSVPQAMIWIETPPNSNRGEPHAGEHLVLGKGKKGKLFSLMLDMSMGSNSASTYRDKTIYHFYTAGGRQSFLELTYRLLDTLLHPDFTDEEIRREVAHLAVSENEATGELRLEERGTVYTEMISSFEKSGTVIWSEIRKQIYGADHPLGMESGGEPSAIRTTEPFHIHEFFDRCYVPGESMGLIVGLPRGFGVRRYLSDLDGIFRKSFNGFIAQAADVNYTPPFRELPPWQAPTGSEIHLLPYPAAAETEPGDVVIAWPPMKEIALGDRIALEMAWQVLAGDQTSFLHKDLIDTSTRIGPAGLTSVSGWINSTAGHPAMIWLSGVPNTLLNADSLGWIRDIMTDRISWLSALTPESDELAVFNEKIRINLISAERDLRQAMESPPRFGYRGTGDLWYSLLRDLELDGGFGRNLMKQQHYETLTKSMESGNPWTALIERIGLSPAPVTVVAAYPDTKLPAAQEAAKEQRLRAELMELKARFATTDSQETLAMFKAKFDADTAELEAIEKEIPRPGFISDPPLSLDEMIQTEIDSIAIADEGQPVPLCVNRFQSTSLVDTGIFYDINGVEADQLIYLPLLPKLISDLGCYDTDGNWLEYFEVDERLQREINAFSTEYSNFVRPRGGRLEFAIYASGLGADESRSAVAWTDRLLTSAMGLTADRLPRLLDMIEQEIAGLRRMQYGAEEGWAHNPSGAYRFQRNKVYLSAVSIFTKIHHLNRLSWQLETPPDEAHRAALTDALRGALARGGDSREGIYTELDTLMVADDDLIRRTAGYLRGELEWTPDEMVAEDFSRLIGQLFSDLTTSPEDVLVGMKALLGSLLAQGPSRTLITGNDANIAEIKPLFAELTKQLSELGVREMETLNQADRLDSAAAGGGKRPFGAGTVVENMASRYPWLSEGEYRDGKIPVYAAFINESSQNALFTNSAPMISYSNLQYPDKISYLASKVFAGSGAHGLFMKTWAAGLAYSNGIGSSPRSGRISYYAERCGDGVETLRFVTGQLEKAPETVDATFFLDYALANSFSDYRGAGTYLSRGRAMASDLADGISPDRVRNFKRSLLRMREQWQQVGADRAAPELGMRAQQGPEDILRDIIAELPSVAGPVLPGYGRPASSVSGTVNFMIAPTTQIDAFETFLATQEPGVRLVRIYPRDYWID
jgi:Zn-dependent M16 (insulinase) family peptidase